MLKIGIVGFGFMGRMHWACWQRIRGARVVALCDSNPNLLQDAKKAVGNIAGAAQAIDFSGLRLYHDLDEMLSDTRLDAVSVSLPTHLHAEASIRALLAGVHVLCEKPMALTLEQCDRMIAAARETGRILQIGHCIRFWPEYAKAAEIVRSGRYGAVKAATFRRLSAAPTWAIDGWLADERRSGGLALDLHIHDTDYILHLLGRPSAVCSHGARANPAGPLTHVITNYLYDDTQVVMAEGSWAATPAYGFQMAFTLFLESATVVYDSKQSPALRVYPEKGEAFTPRLKTGDGYIRQIEHFVQRLRGRTPPVVTTVEASRESVEVVQAEIRSIRRGKSISLS